MHHWSTVTSSTLCEDVEAINVWRTVVPYLAFPSENVFLLHAILAVAALHRHHLSATYPAPDTYSEAALIHHTKCMETYPSEVSGSGSAVFLSHFLIGVYGFATSTTSVYAPSKWLDTIRNMPATLVEQWPRLQESSLGPLARIIVPRSIQSPSIAYPPLLASIHSEGPDIDEVHDIGTSAAYEHASILLKRSWDASFHVDHHLIAAATLLTIASERFLTLLRQGRPRALILFAHYCTMMARMERTWWTRKAWREELKKVEARLDARWAGWIESAVILPEWETGMDPELVRWMFSQPTSWT